MNFLKTLHTLLPDLFGNERSTFNQGEECWPNIFVADWLQVVEDPVHVRVALLCFCTEPAFWGEIRMKYVTLGGLV